VHTLVYDLFALGTNELAHRHPDRAGGGSAEIVVNRYKLIVLTNAVCLELMVWAAQDENGMFYLFFGSSLC
jgi:hypothetical protein